MSKLRLGPLPSTETTKVTIALPAALRADLERYAKLHAETWGQAVELSALIPHMLEAFIRRDRAFSARARAAGRGGSGGAPG
ncbi:MAG: DUF2274 domain-containing protein [Burkholderiaceae bacterium]|nr:DUF2274 domain-containing protein [Burkholderiaceae bacterium]